MEVSGWLVRVLELQRSFVGAISLRKAASRIGLKYLGGVVELGPYFAWR